MMFRSGRPQVTVLAFVLAFAGVSGAVVAAERALEASLDVLLPSAPAPLLDAISEAGRTGWTCRPEVAAGASTAAKAALPAPER